MKKQLTAMGILCLSLLLVASVALGQNPDYGDAPDPSYPSLAASGGPTHAILTDTFVGWTSTGEPNALVPDLDADDGAPVIFASNAPGMWTGWVYVPVTLSASAPPGNRYLNVLLDSDADGTWCNQPGEWVVRNYTVYYQPGVTLYYCLGGFTFVNSYSGAHWLRVTVSETPIVANLPTGWDGSWPPGFNIGETEDWLLGWNYSPHGPIPPHDPQDPPAPVPLPECNKSATVYQTPPPTHYGHSGGFGIEVKNDGTHPIHIIEGPFVTGPHGDPITITPTESLESTILQPGETASVPATWGFTNKAPNQASCDFEVVHDPQGQTVVVGNVGDYTDATGMETTGGTFEEEAVHSMTNSGLMLLVVALVLLSAYLVVRRRRLGRQEV